MVDTTIARIRGTALMSFQAYLQAQHGPEAFGRVIAALAEEDRSALQGILLPVEWYPTRAFIRALDGARDLYGPADFHERYGAAAAEYELNRFFRILLRFTNPGWLMDRGTRVWRDSHNTGHWTIERGERSLRGTLSDFGVVSAGYCRVLVGWIRRASQLTGARTVTMEHPRCRAQGAPSCVFALGW